MRRLAKAMSAFTAGRDASSGVKESGARSHAHISLLAPALVAFLAMTFASPASAAPKLVDLVVGTTSSGATDGLFNAPRDIAVNYTGAGGTAPGTIYVAEQTNHRISRFSPAGVFERSWGADVVSAGPGNSGTNFEICVSGSDTCKAGVAGAGNAGDNLRNGQLSNPQGIAVDPDTGDVYVTDRGNFRVSQYAPNGVFVRSFGYDVTSAVNEIQTVTVNAAAGQFKLTFNGQQTGDLEFDASAANVQSALSALSTIAPGSVTVSGGPGAAGGGAAYTVTFSSGAGIAASNVSLLVSSQGTTPLSGGAGGGADTATVTTTVQGGGSSSAFEVCAAADRCKIGTTGANPGQFGNNNQSWRLDVSKDGSPGSGFLAVADPGNTRVQLFDFADLTTSTPPSTEQGEIFGSSAIFASGSSGRPIHVAIAPNGVIYTANHTGSSPTPTYAVYRWDTKAIPPAFVPGGPLSAETLIGRGGGNIGLAGLEVDPFNGNLLIINNPSSTGGDNPAGDTLIREIANPASATPAVADLHMQGSGDRETNGLGVDHTGSRDKLFVTVGNQLFVLDADGANPPASGVPTPPINVGPHEATFQGIVDPAGATSIPTSYAFEYSKNGIAWTKVPASTGPFTGGAVAVKDTVTGLEANTFYRVRLIIQRNTLAGSAGSTVSPELTFLTDAPPPTVQTLQTSIRSDTGAEFIGRLNPEGSETTWHFEYGTTTSYGQKAPLPAMAATGGIDRFVSTEIGGLQSETTYHYRLVATNSEGTTNGNDLTVTTRMTPAELPVRGYEMVTPPFKVIRISTDPLTGGNRPDLAENLGLPSLDGDSYAWSTVIFPLTDEVNAPGDGDRRLYERTSKGWVGHTRNTLAILDQYNPHFASSTPLSSSGDLQTITWNTGGYGGNFATGILPTEGPAANPLYTRRSGTGIEGFTPWLSNPSVQVWGQGFSEANSISPVDQSILNDDGSAMARWGWYRGLAEDSETPGDDDPSDEQQLPGVEGGDTAYLQRASDPDLMPAAPKDLVSECTGAGSEATQIPSRVGTGAATDAIGAQSCAMGSLTSARGANIGGGQAMGNGENAGPGGVLAGPSATALADDGNRVFFLSPDPGASLAPTACKATSFVFVPTFEEVVHVGPKTDCPPQLYVRQYDSNGEATVRWISRAQGMPTQQIGLLGRGVSFQGASRDGRYVYFKTDAPLTADDPNGTAGPGPITTGNSSGASWDLYRYELPADLNEDPANGTLVRISGGPTGTADPSVNRLAATVDDSALRFLSDDGKRAFFLTTSPIAGADSTPPIGGSTSPGGTPGNGGNTSGIRNLYLFDDTAIGPDRYKFIAQLPYSRQNGTSNPVALNMCATAFSEAQGPQLGHGITGGNHYLLQPGNCFRGAASGDAVVFFTGARLTHDDIDDAGDIYLYDTRNDELVRVSAPPAPGTLGYGCGVSGSSAGVSDPSNIHARCNGHLISNVGSSNGGDPDFARGWGGYRYQNIAQDSSGEVSVFFESRSQLLPEDTNDDLEDVYEWRNGELSLISRGLDDRSWFAGNSTDGEDVFFHTGDRIDPREVDASDRDIYDARINGGFLYTPPPTPCDVLAFECESAAISAASVRGAATASYGGAGNVRQAPIKPRQCAKGKVRRSGKCVRKKKAKKRAAHKTGRASR